MRPVNRIRRKPKGTTNEAEKKETPFFSSQSDKTTQPDNAFFSSNKLNNSQQSGNNAAPEEDNLQEKINKAKFNGRTLPANILTDMQDRFSFDFSNVRVYTGKEATALNHQLGSDAFTTGNDIFFANEEIDFNSNEGVKLLAHELAHVAQEGGANKEKVRRQVTEAEEAQWALANPGGITSVDTMSTDQIPDNEFMLWNFLVGSDELRQSHKQKLIGDIIPRWKTLLNTRTDLKINIIGSASSSGKQTTNDSLAIRRAENIKSLLTGSGIPDTKIINSGVGTTQPLAPEHSAENMARNRRAEVFLFVPTKKVTTLGNKVKSTVKDFESSFDATTRANTFDTTKNFAHIRSGGITSKATVSLTGDSNTQLSFIQFLTGDTRIGNYLKDNGDSFTLDYANCTNPFLPCRDVHEATSPFSFENKAGQSEKVAGSTGKETTIHFLDRPGVVFPAKESGGTLQSFNWRMDFVLVLGIRQGENFLPLKFQNWFLEYSAEPDAAKKNMKILSSKVEKSKEGDGDPGIDVEKAMQGRTCRFVMRRIESPESSVKGCRPEKK